MRLQDGVESLKRVAAIAVIATCCVSSGCAGTSNVGLQPDAPPRAAQLVGARAAAQRRSTDTRFDGSLQQYVQHALSNNPALESAWHRYRAEVYEANGTGTLPEPTISYAYFLRPVETRVGPQQHKIGVSQAFPWPGTLSSAQSAAKSKARAARLEFEAAGYQVVHDVRDAYWQVWLVAELDVVKKAQLQLLKQLAVSARARLEIGKANLADVGQIELMSSRVADERAGLKESRARSEAQLRAALAVERDVAVPVTPKHAPLLHPVETEEELQRAAGAHPRITKLDSLAQAQRELADSSRAAGMPGFRVGAEYIVTGEARGSTPDSGKDPVIVGISAAVPLWRGDYDARESSSRARSRALLSQQRLLRVQAAAQVTALLSRLRDERRRLELYDTTLAPQAKSVLESALGAYQVGEGGIAPVLLATRELLDIEAKVAEAQASQARLLSALEALVGRRVRAHSLRGKAP